MCYDLNCSITFTHTVFFFLLVKADGISIPSGYCSFVAPLASTKIYSRVLELGKFETPYVVMIHSAEIISAQGGPDGEMDKVQETWSFAHPRTDLVFSHITGASN